MLVELQELSANLKKYEEKLSELFEALQIVQAKEEIEILEAETMVEGFWNDLETSQKVSMKLKRLQNKVSFYEDLSSSYEDMKTFMMIASEEDDKGLVPEILQMASVLNEKLESALLSTLLTGEYDKNSAILTFHAGAGGTEAQDWAEMIYRMYVRWAEQHGYPHKMLDELPGDEAGIKSASVLISGENAYGYLKSEAGVHRLVRVSPFDSSGRRHTSFASVEVMPEIDNDDSSFEIDPEDLRIDTFRAGGAGGQHVNKTESAIRITHIPTGVVVSCQNERSQHRNRDTAMVLLKSKLAEIKEREHLERIEDIKGVQKEIGWGSQIRSYVFMPYTMVKDHRTNFEMGNVNDVMDGNLDGFIHEYLTQNVKK